MGQADGSLRRVAGIERRVALLIALAAVLLARQSLCASDSEPRLADVLAGFARSGVRLLYSTELVPPDLRVRGPAQGTTVKDELRSILSPLGLQARPLAGGVFVITRARHAAPARDPETGQGAKTSPPPVVRSLEEITVQTSHYGNGIVPGAEIGRQLLEGSPESHADALRALQMVPGTTAAGYTARTHVRGSRDDEVLFRYDGVTLDEPYHLKELESLFSPIDPSATSTVQSWTGVPPIEYGGAIGGVVDIRPRHIARTTVDLRASEQGFSALAGGRFDQGRGSAFADLRMRNEFAPVGWVDTGIGAPTLSDLIVHVTWRLDEATNLAAGSLALDDRRKYFATDSAETKTVRGGEIYTWLRLHHRFETGLRSDTLFSTEDSHENVDGRVDQPLVMTGTLAEHSFHRILSLREDLRGGPGARWYWHVGGELRTVDLSDRSLGSGVVAAPFYPGLQPGPVLTSNENVAASGITDAFYGGLRWRLRPGALFDVGLRRDERKFDDARSDAQWSLRANALFALPHATILRLGWGQESQADVLDPRIHPTGVVPQSARRLTQSDVSLEHHDRRGAIARIEAYDKRQDTPLSKSVYLFAPFSLIPELAIDKYRLTSQRSHMYGVELSYTTDPRRALSGSVSYTWSRALDEVAGLWIPRQWDQPQALKVSGLWRVRAYSFAAALDWHSGWPSTPLIASSTSWTDPSAVSLRFGPIDSTRMGDYLSLDLRIGWRHALRPGVFEAYLEIYDLTNAHSPCCDTYSVSGPVAGTYQLVDTRLNWLNPTPIVGVRWHF
ncbi:MAG: TonB-dependent receptor [Gammaproteobacteria bacterium]|nr:TonB-dependent receptor [Gammaproteobacteria bacterium]